MSEQEINEFRESVDRLGKLVAEPYDDIVVENEIRS
jgi:hypothetical protein